MSDKEKAEITELRAALGVMLAAWDNSSLLLTNFIKDNTKENAEIYMASMPVLFDAAVAGRVIYERSKLKNLNIS